MVVLATRYDGDPGVSVLSQAEIAAEERYRTAAGDACPAP